MDGNRIAIPLRNSFRFGLEKSTRRSVSAISIKLFLPYFPLGLVLVAREKYPKLSQVFKTMVSLHHQALAATLSDARLFLLAKGLELATEFISGKTYAEKTANLPEALRSGLKHDLNWLFQIANTRVNIRHVVQKGANPPLHKKINGPEARDFEHDVDFMIRFYVAGQFGYQAPLFTDA